jgi:Tfp pilus assembly protein PilO
MTPRRMNHVLKITILVFVIGVAAGIYFADKQLKSIATDTARLRAQVEIGDKQLTTYQATKQKVDSLSYVQELAGKVLPEQQEQSLTVAEISQFALRARLTVEDITFIDTTKTTTTKTKSTDKKAKSTIPKGVSVIPMSIKFQDGSRYDYLLEFLKSVEDNRRKMQVTNISLTPDADNRALLKSVTVELNLYVRSQEKTTEKKSE